ncbi:hypothetical protein Ddye_010271 [Dipteronia dyeriana]|uniref:DUF659 domain-containing protein n=1 Tax=Dipteronia dyeriana TaxID=168575 RepID=A0AAE0CN58_9ROSI|nr:hypothetical protein Ddye_010271 [Dipteronia dyeriana]
MESIDASTYARIGEKMFELFSKVVEKVGKSNVIQVVTDGASNNVLAGKNIGDYSVLGVVVVMVVDSGVDGFGSGGDV